jgi:hypothetical protein
MGGCRHERVLHKRDFDVAVTLGAHCPFRHFLVSREGAKLLRPSFASSRLRVSQSGLLRRFAARNDAA